MQKIKFSTAALTAVILAAVALKTAASDTAVSDTTALGAVAVETGDAAGQQVVVAADGKAGDGFGYGVAIDGYRLLVGAYKADLAAVNFHSGSVQTLL